MDPRRELDERIERLRRSKVPFIETYRETALEDQSLGPPLEREIIVIRIDKGYLKLFFFFCCFFILLIVINFLWS